MTLASSEAVSGLAAKLRLAGAYRRGLFLRAVAAQARAQVQKRRARRGRGPKAQGRRPEFPRTLAPPKFSRPAQTAA